MKLQQKFFIIFFLIAAVPIVLISTIAYRRYYVATYEQMDEYSYNIFEKAVKQTNSTLEDVNKAANMFTFYGNGTNSLIQNLKPYAEPDADDSPLAIYQTKQNIKYICLNILNSYDFIYGLYVFTPSGITLDYESNPRAKLRYQYDPKEEDWFKDTVDLKGTLYVSGVSTHTSMFSGEQESVFFAKYLYDVYSHKYLGVLVINCSPSIFDLSNINTMPDIVSFYIHNQNTGEPIYASSQDSSEPPAPVPLKTRVQSAVLAQPGLTLTSAVNYERLYGEFNLTGIILITLAVSCLAAALVLSYILSHYLTRPIVNLSRIMSQQKGDGLSACEQYPDRTDEIGILYNEYNHMVEKLNASIKTDYQNKLIALDAQMKSLEARINSHFLFNTLASINSIAEIEGSERLSTMSIALGNMFRYAIKTKSELVTVQDELDHVNDYVSIQSIRFDNRFTLETRVPDSMRGLTVLKLILQPLVENAISHGLLNCQTGSRITITGAVTDVTGAAATVSGGASGSAGGGSAPGFPAGFVILLSVSDDGQGMEPEHLAQLKQSLEEEAQFTELGHRNNRSIGIRNIHSRIRLYYGESYGLSIESRKNEGTCITIKLPILDKEGGTCTHIS